MHILPAVILYEKSTNENVIKSFFLNHATYLKPIC